MKSSRSKSNLIRLIILCVALLSVAALSYARTPATSATIVNASTKEVVNVYLSHINGSDWSGNQLGNAKIQPGQSFTLNNVACDQQQVRVIAEDEDGCFVYNVVNCGDSAVVTITDLSTRDCGN